MLDNYTLSTYNLSFEDTSHSYEQSVAGEGRPMDEVFAELENIERLSE